MPIKPPLPSHEPARLTVIERHGLTDPGREYVYDQMAELAAELFSVPIALVSVVGRDFQCFRGVRGLDLPGTPRDYAFCAFAILSDEVMVVPDACEDERFRDHPLVTGPPHIRFYAGAPLVLEGQAIGTLCIIDPCPRVFGEQDKRRLRSLADLVEETLRMRLDRIAAEEADRRLRHIIDAMPAGLLVYDKENRLVTTNVAFRGMIFGDRDREPEPGLTRQELLDLYEGTGRSVELVSGAGSFRDHLAACEHKEPYEILTSDGKWLSVRETRTPDGYLISTNTDITELKKREQETKLQRELLRSTIESVDEGIALFEGGTLVVSNDRLSMLLRVPKQTIRAGCGFAELVNGIVERGSAVDGDATFFSDPAAELRSEEESRAATFELTNARLLHLTATARSGGTVILTCADVTEKRQIERLKADFVSTVSHELRTPLTSISGALRILGSGFAGKLSDKAAELVELARKNSDRLVRLVNDLLEADRLQSGELRLDSRPMDLRPVLERAVEQARAYAAEVGTRVEFSMDFATDPVFVNADEARLLQVADNLLSNAVKFSPLGGTVAVSASGECGRSRFSVTDQGPGIPEEFRPQIFHRFTRADNTDRRATQGSGLGLSIARGIVQQHGGSIGFNSTPGEGSTFWVELPLHVEQAERPREPRNTARPPTDDTDGRTEGANR